MKEITPENQGIHHISQKNKTPDSLRQGSGLPGDFSKILSEQLEDTGTSGLTDGDNMGLPELGATYNAQLAGLAQDQTRLPELISDSIDLLENYADLLSDPEKTLKQAYGLLEQIQLQTLDIGKELIQGEDGSSQLKGILDHLSTVVELEKIKINRGDYS
jgi:hypothetical protein